MNWFVWRVLTHGRIRATLHEIETHWSLDDLLDAHLVIQVHEQAEFIAEQRRKNDASSPSRRFRRR